MDPAGAYDFLIHGLGDPRVKDNPLLNTPWPTFGIIAVYVYAVRVLGPRFMKDKEPFAVETLMKVYDVIQIAWNFYMGSMIFVYAALFPIRILCIPMDLTGSAASRLVEHGCRLYFYNKIFDLADTAFFILRKKLSHASHLHLYHHSSMILAGWICVKYSPGGNVVMIGVTNSWVHVVMYTYYLLTAMNNGQYFWWKKHITQLQILQFVLLLLHNAQVFINPSCDLPVPITLIAIAQASYLLYLFSNFYVNSYIRQKKNS